MSRFPSDITETVAALAARAPGNLQAWMARHEARVRTVVGLAARKARPLAFLADEVLDELIAFDTKHLEDELTGAALARERRRLRDRYRNYPPKFQAAIFENWQRYGRMNPRHTGVR